MKYSYRLSNREIVHGDRARSVIDDCYARGLLAGDFWASWSDKYNLGEINLQLRVVSMKITIDDMPRDKFMQFIDLLTLDAPDVTDVIANDFYISLLGLELAVKNDLVN